MNAPPTTRAITTPLLSLAGVVVGGLGACFLLAVKMLDWMEAARG